MGIVIRQSIKSSVISYSGVVIGAFSYLWLFPKYLDPAQIGIIQFVQSAAITLASFLQFSGGSTLIRFIPHFGKKDSGAFFNFILVYILPFLALGLIIMLVLKDTLTRFYLEESPEIIPYFYHIFALIIIYVFITMIEAYARANYRIVVPNFLKDILLRILSILLVVAFLFEFITFRQLILGLIINYVIVLLIGTGYLINLKVLTSRIIFPTVRKLKEMISYSSFAVVGNASNVVISRIDILMIGSMLGMDFLGVFTITFFMGNIIEIPKRAITQIASPIISNHWKSNDLRGINELYGKAAINLLIVGSVIFLGIWMNVDFIFNVIPNSDIYETGKYVILFIALAKLIDMSAGPNSEIIVFSDYYKFNLLLSVILAVLLVITNLIFIPLWGITGAAFATFLSMILYNLIKYLYLKIKFKLDPFSKKYAVVIIIGVATYLIVQFINLSNIWWQTIIRSVSIVVLFGGLVYIFQLSSDLNNTINTLFKQAKKRLF